MFVPPDTGPVGWFPLAPGEVYWPSYTATRDRERWYGAGDEEMAPSSLANN
jgi:hypothetical protein